MSPATRPTLLAVAVAVALPAAGCGGDSDPAPEGQAAAPPAAAFPKAGGRTLEELVAEATPTNDIVASPSGVVFEPGDQRFGFGLFQVDRTQIPDAEIAIYAAHGAGGRALGPFPARIESMETEPEFVAQTTADDPDAAQVVYVADVPFAQTGEWRLLALIREDDGLLAAVLPSVVVSEHPRIPDTGEPAPSVHTPTAAEVGGDVAVIDTRVPVGTMHEDDLADVLGKEPVVLLFATPALCVSRVCGPVVDVAEQVKAETGDDVAFIHNEIYENNQPPKLREQVRAYGLESEPWLFVIDEDGRVSTRIEGAFGLGELEQAVQKVLS